MDSDVLYEQRKTAIHLLRCGLSPTQVAVQLDHSRAWVYKWWNRYDENKDFNSLHDRSRAPIHSPRELCEEIRLKIKMTRSELEAEAAEGSSRVNIGAKAVQKRLRINGCVNVPSLSSIGGVLRRAGMTRRRDGQYRPVMCQSQNSKVQGKACKYNITAQQAVEIANSEECTDRGIAKQRQAPSEKSNRSQSNTEEQDSLWILKLLQGKIGLNKLEESLAGKLDSNDIRRLLDYVLEKPLRYRNRAVIILAYLTGISKRIIASSLLVSRGGTYKCIERYELKGIEELLKPSWNIAKKADDPRYEETIFRILHAPPSSYGINRTTWRMSDIKRVMATLGLEMSEGYISKIIRDAGYKVRKAKKVLTSNDPNYKEKVQHIKDILSNLGEKEKFFSIDEYGLVAIKIHGGRSLVPPGEVRTVPQFQKSKGSLIVTAALELSTNQVTHFYSEKKDTEEMIKLLEILLEEYRDEECLYLSWDAASWHDSKKLNEKVEEVNSPEYRTEHGTPMVELAPLPSRAQFLNVIESIISGMARAIIHNSDYGSEEECMKAIDQHLAERNQHFKENPKRAGNKIWGKERVKPEFSESNNCKDPSYR